MSDRGRLPLLWSPDDFRAPRWQGRSEGVFQTTGDVAAEQADVELLCATHACGDSGGCGRVFIPRLWESEESGPTLAWVRLGGRKLRAVFQQGDAVLCCFDPAETVEAMLFERYRGAERRPLAARSPIPYQWFVPRPLRTPIKRAAGLFRGLQADRFPTWPRESGLLTLASLCLPKPTRAGWPDGRRFALCVSHDVESAAGVRLAEEAARVDAAYGVKSTWFVVGRLASRARRLADRLKADGCEIGLHGTHHDMAFPFLTRGEMEKRLDACRSFVDDYDARGFRSPALLRTDLMYELIGERFAYDSSVVDSGRLSPHARPTGCASVFPFLRGGLPVVPITLPMDSALLFLGYDDERMLKLWEDKLNFIASWGGAAVFVSHTEPHFFGSKAGLAAYERFLKMVAAREDAWLATLGELADHVTAAKGETDR